MSLQFIMGNSGAGKSRYAYQKILAEAMRHPEKTYLIIVPEQFTMQTQIGRASCRERVFRAV